MCMSIYQFSPSITKVGEIAMGNMSLNTPKGRPTPMTDNVSRKVYADLPHMRTQSVAHEKQRSPSARRAKDERV